MSLQNIRYYYEKPVVDWCADNSVELRVDNMLEPGGDAASEFVVSRFNFGEMTEPSLCGLKQNIRGSFIVEFFGPKGDGPGRAQEVMQGIMCKLMELTQRPKARDVNGVLGTLGPITGPLFTALDERPYFFGSISMPILASLGDAPEEFVKGAIDLDDIDSQTSLPDFYKPILKRAASRWNKLIKYNSTIYDQIKAAETDWNGLKIGTLTVQNESDTNPDAIASCGPNKYASVGGDTTVKFTTITYNLNIYTKFQSTYDEDEWEDILAHELGHAFGIGAYWDSEFEDDGAVVPVNSLLDGTAYVKTQEAYNAITSLNRSKIPLENTGGAGTKDGHWSDSFRTVDSLSYPGYDDELMIGSIRPGDTRVISQQTINALVDFSWEEVKPGTNEGVPTLVEVRRRAARGITLQPADLSNLEKIEI